MNGAHMLSSAAPAQSTACCQAAELTATSVSKDMLASSGPVGATYHANQVIFYDVISLGLFIFKGNQAYRNCQGPFTHNGDNLEPASNLAGNGKNRI